MNLNGVVDVLGVAARHDGRYGHAARAALAQDYMVARAKARNCEREAAQAVADEGVCAA